MRKGVPERSWFFPVYSGLLHNTHKKKIGDAIWHFLWCIDKTTLEEDDPNDPGEKIGWVLQKKPVTIDEIAKQFGESWRTTQRRLEILRSQKYITVARARRGIIIGVLKSKKWTGRKTNVTPEEREILNFLKGISEYPYNYQTDLEFLRTLRVDFPGIKILEELAKWRVWLWDNRSKLRGDVNYRLRFRNWMANAAKWGKGARGGGLSDRDFAQLTKSRSRLERHCGRQQILEELEKLNPFLHDSLRKFLDKTYPQGHSYHKAKDEYEKRHRESS